MLLCISVNSPIVWLYHNLFTLSYVMDNWNVSGCQLLLIKPHRSCDDILWRQRISSRRERKTSYSRSWAKWGTGMQTLAREVLANLGSGRQTSVCVCLQVRVQTCPTLLFGPYYLSYTFPFCKTKSHVVSWTFYILSHLFVFEYTILWSAIYLLIQHFPVFSFSFFESQLRSKHFFCCWV